MYTLYHRMADLIVFVNLTWIFTCDLWSSIHRPSLLMLDRVGCPRFESMWYVCSTPSIIIGRDVYHLIAEHSSWKQTWFWWHAKTGRGSQLCCAFSAGGGNKWFWCLTTTFVHSLEWHLTTSKRLAMLYLMFNPEEEVTEFGLPPLLIARLLN